MKGMLLSLFLILFYLHAIQGYWNLEKYHRYFLKRERAANCRQDTPNCNQCLAKSGCSWCGSDGIFKCSTKQSCSQRPKQTCSPDSPARDPLQRFPSENLQSFFDIPVSDKRSNMVFGGNSCSTRTNCSYCTSLQSCAWCENTRKCLPHYNSTSTTKACGTDNWYKDQCLYSSKVKPCHERTDGCKECTSDGVCFWCKSTGNCSYYLHDAFVPENCPSGSWYYKSCSHMRLIVVLAPILAILGAPILIFIVLAIVLWCMKRMGYEGLDDSDDEDKEESESPSATRPFLMNHKSPPSKVEELKKKYNLEDEP